MTAAPADARALSDLLSLAVVDDPDADISGLVEGASPGLDAYLRARWVVGDRESPALRPFLDGLDVSTNSYLAALVAERGPDVLATLPLWWIFGSPALPVTARNVPDLLRDGAFGSIAVVDSRYLAMQRPQPDMTRPAVEETLFLDLVHRRPVDPRSFGNWDRVVEVVFPEADPASARLAAHAAVDRKVLLSGISPEPSSATATVIARLLTRDPAVSVDVTFSDIDRIRDALAPHGIVPSRVLTDPPQRIDTYTLLGQFLVREARAGAVRGDVYAIELGFRVKDPHSGVPAVRTGMAVVVVDDSATGLGDLVLPSGDVVAAASWTLGTSPEWELAVTDPGSGWAWLFASPTGEVTRFGARDNGPRRRERRRASALPPAPADGASLDLLSRSATAIARGLSRDIGVVVVSPLQDRLDQIRRVLIRLDVVPVDSVTPIPQIEDGLTGLAEYVAAETAAGARYGDVYVAEMVGGPDPAPWYPAFPFPTELGEPSREVVIVVVEGPGGRGTVLAAGGTPIATVAGGVLTPLPEHPTPDWFDDTWLVQNVDRYSALQLPPGAVRVSPYPESFTPEVVDDLTRRP